MLSGYCASKWAVRGFSIAMRAELYGTGIGITTVYLAWVDTPMFRLEAERTEGLPIEVMLTPEQVAEEILEAVRQGKRDPTLAPNPDIALRIAPFLKGASHSLDASLSRLGLQTLDRYLIHFLFTLLSVDRPMDMLAEAVKAGKIRAVGVSNFSAQQRRRAAARLALYHIPLAANEAHYSLLQRRPEVNGVLDACRELDVALVAYRPLDGGRLIVGNAAEEVAGESSEHGALRQTLRAIAQQHDTTVSQVALNWLVRAGMITSSRLWARPQRAMLLRTPLRLPGS